MDTVMSQETLKEVLDQILREMTEQTAEIQLYQGEAPPGGELHTVYARFERGFHFILSLCAAPSVFLRLTQAMMQGDAVTARDVEDFSKEYCNVLCGHIAAALFRHTGIASRFKIPVFCYGRYQPEELPEQFVLHYFSDQNESVQLTYYAACP